MLYTITLMDCKYFCTIVNMPRVYASIPKFKRIEASLRGTIIAYGKVINEVNTALMGPRADEEIILLNSISKECSELQQKSRDLLKQLYREVDNAT